MFTLNPMKPICVLIYVQMNSFFLKYENFYFLLYNGMYAPNQAGAISCVK